MSDDFEQYERQVTTGELRPYVPGESLFNITVSEQDIQNYGCPKAGDMVARDPKDRDNQWLVSKEYFEKHYKPAPLRFGAPPGERPEEGDDDPVPYPDLDPDVPDPDPVPQQERVNQTSGGPAKLGKDPQF